MMTLASRHRGIASCALVLLLGVTGTGCLGIEGSGVLRSQERSVLEFHAIDASGALDLEVVQGSPQRVEVSTDDNLLPLLRTEVHGGTLTIEMKGLVDTTGAIRVRITAPAIDAVSLSGSSDAKIKGFTGQSFQLETSGSGSVTLDAMNLTGTLAINSSGSSEIRAQGESRALTIDTSGSSTIDTRPLAAASVAIDASGSADILVFAKDSLIVNVSGSGDVGYLGQPRVEASVSGAGEVQHL
jgi:Putative auto-transporter adhesin, head GIN domain